MLKVPSWEFMSDPANPAIVPIRPLIVWNEACTDKVGSYRFRIKIALFSTFVYRPAVIEKYGNGYTNILPFYLGVLPLL